MRHDAGGQREHGTGHARPAASHALEKALGNSPVTICADVPRHAIARAATPILPRAPPPPVAETASIRAASATAGKR